MTNPSNTLVSRRRRTARFNRYVANHVFGPLLTRSTAFGTVRHRGRRSGRVYHTPVKVFRRGSDYVITLPYGSGCDWVRNVMAARGCELVIGDAVITLGDPVILTDLEAVAIPRPLRWILARMKVTEGLALTPTAGATERAG